MGPNLWLKQNSIRFFKCESHDSGFLNVLLDDVQIKELTNIAHSHNFTTQ